MKKLLIFSSFFLALNSQANAAKSIEDLWKIQAYPAGLFKKKEVKLTEKEQEFYSVILDKLKRSTSGSELLKTAKHLGVGFSGFTYTVSKANTNPKTRLIKISEDLDSDTATLSLAYELSNAINSQRYLGIFEEARYKEINDSEYANKIIELEAEANLWRSKVAQELGFENLIKNKNYYDIATADGVYASEHERFYELLNEIKDQGTVGKLKIPVIEHYQNQFKKYFE